MNTIILSFDPGKYNFAYSFMTVSGKILKTGLLNFTMTDLKNIKSINLEIEGFIEEIKSLINDTNYKFRVVFERFIPRGSKYFGNLIEITCMKIGLLLSVLKMNCDCVIIPILASSWKNYLNKRKLRINNDSCPEHILDAVSMAYYYLLTSEKLTDIQVKNHIKKLQKINFKWYLYKGNWYYGKRIKSHFRGKRNSFGN